LLALIPFLSHRPANYILPFHDHYYALHCPSYDRPSCSRTKVQPHLLASRPHRVVHTIIGFTPLSKALLSATMLVGACSFFFHSDLAFTVCLLLLAGQHVARANRVCTTRGGVAVAHDWHMIKRQQLLMTTIMLCYIVISLSEQNAGSPM